MLDYCLLERILYHALSFKNVIEFFFAIVLQIGIVSDDDLLDLLDLALSSKTSNMVIRARELMRSRIDPMQLITQLANLIMDILAGKCQEGSSEVRRKFSIMHTCKYYGLSSVVSLSYFTSCCMKHPWLSGRWSV